MHRYHHTLSLMKRLNHMRGGEPKVAPFGVNIFGVLSKDAHKVMVKLAGVQFSETPHCLSYLSARQKWIDWWIRIIQKNVSEAVVTGIEAGFAHRARLAQDLAMSPQNPLRSPSRGQYIQIANKKWEVEERTSNHQTTSQLKLTNNENTLTVTPNAKPH